MAPSADIALRYLQDGADLRVALQYNLLDWEFTQKGGRIVYLVDANVVRLFLSPSAEDVTPFTGDQGQYLEKTAVVTAEYLFSRQLPGQGGAPVLIAPGHGDDLGYIIGALREETESVADKGEPAQQVLTELDRS